MLKEPVATQFEMSLGTEEHSYGGTIIEEYSSLTFLLVPDTGDYQIKYGNDTIITGKMALQYAAELNNSRSARWFYCIQIKKQQIIITAQNESNSEDTKTWKLSYTKTRLEF